MKLNKYIQRLANEWHVHGRIVVAVDYDSTLFYWPTIENQEDIQKVIRILKDVQQVGAYIVVFTASSKERFNEIINHCNKIGINVDSINENPIPLPYGHDGKIFYNINLCDRSGLNEALDTLETAMCIQRSRLSAKRTSYPGALG